MQDDNVFAVDTSGWVAQNAGRHPWELFRELLQNALDAAENTDRLGEVKVVINTRKREVSVEDNGDGFSDLKDVWTIFGGDKGDDPTNRGRFGRGIKEQVAGSETSVYETTAGTVEFQIDRENDKYQKFVDEKERRAQGTKVTVVNEQWTTDDMQEMQEYLDKLWVPADVDITVDVAGGRTRKPSTRQASHTFEMRIPTVKFEDNLKQEIRRTTEVRVRFAGGAGNKGKIYEMGIPAQLEWRAPYEVDIQQRIPMAEQRNEVDKGWLRQFEPKFLNEMMEHLPSRELNEEWVTSNIDSFYVDQDTKELYVDRRFKTGKPLVASSDAAADDKAENHGYDVLDTDTMSNNVKSVVQDSVESSQDVALRILERDEEQVESTPEQEAFVEEVTGMLSEAGVEPCNVEFWRLAPTRRMETNYADYNKNTDTIRLNVEARDWEEVNGENVMSVVHEIAHRKGTGHNMAWANEMQRVAGQVLDNEL